MTEWQAANLPDSLPLHIRRNIDEGDGGCWVWNRSRDRDGYGWASLNDKTHLAHRLVYSLVKGDLEPGMVLDHLCRVRHCVNPAHLDQVTSHENLLRSPLTPAGAAMCVKGHGLSRWNGQRRCLICRADYQKARKDGTPWESRRPWSVKESA